jgi:hypothetical protein
MPEAEVASLAITVRTRRGKGSTALHIRSPADLPLGIQSRAPNIRSSHAHFARLTGIEPRLSGTTTDNSRLHLTQQPSAPSKAWSERRPTTSA